MKQTKQFKIIVAVGVTLLLVSLGFVLYPTFSNFINQLNNNAKIIDYTKRVDNISSADKAEFLSKAEEYNKRLSSLSTDVKSKNTADYKDILNIDNGIMGTVEIPKIDVKLPIYHGTEDEELSLGAGHMPNTSFPIGGEDTHSVISAHTAYPGHVFFDDLPDLEVGDVFYIKVLTKTLKYRVCEVNIVDPDDTTKLKIVDGKDYVSLLTCYPYAVNTHRLIVTGERVLEGLSSDPIINDESSSDDFTHSVIIIVVMLCILFLVILSTIVFIIRKHKFK